VQSGERSAETLPKAKLHSKLHEEDFECGDAAKAKLYSKLHEAEFTRVPLAPSWARLETSSHR
jgi:hypothetical protein